MLFIVYVEQQDINRVSVRVFDFDPSSVKRADWLSDPAMTIVSVKNFVDRCLVSHPCFFPAMVRRSDITKLCYILDNDIIQSYVILYG